MPDNDRFAIYLPAKWGPVSTALHVRDAPAAGVQIGRALAHSLRESGGIPGLASIAADAVRAATPALIPDTAERVGQDLSAAATQNANTRLALDCARAWELAPPDGAASSEDFVVDVLTAYSRRHCLEKVAPRLVANGIADAAETRLLIDAALNAAPLLEIARQILAREDAATLKAPGRTRRSIESILGTPFSELPS
jgi:hypothetical protein